MAWRRGPLPPNTWHWGGVVCRDTPKGYFHFANFCGDHAKLIPDDTVIEREDVLWYDNGIEEPPGEPESKVQK